MKYYTQYISGMTNAKTTHPLMYHSVDNVFKLKAQIVSEPVHVIGFVLWKQEAIRDRN